MNLIENAKSHCPVRFGMMTAWTGCTINVVGFAFHNEIDAHTGCADTRHDTIPRSG